MYHEKLLYTSEIDVSGGGFHSIAFASASTSGWRLHQFPAHLLPNRNQNTHGFNGASPGRSHCEANDCVGARHSSCTGDLYLDSTSFEFPAGILEFDTCTATVQRKASQSAVQHAKQKRYKVERKANKFLKRKRMPVMKRPASSSKKTDKIFRGRHIVFKLRCVDGSVATKQYAVLPLPPKVADKGTFDSQTF